MLTVKQTAERLKISTGRVRQLIIEGRIKAEKFGDVWAIDETSLAKFHRLAPGWQKGKGGVLNRLVDPK